MRVAWEWALRACLLVGLALFLAVVFNTSNVDDPVIIQLIGQRAIALEKWEALFGPFLLGGLAGLTAGWMRGARHAQQLATELRTAQEHNRKLEAANRALEASVPILHETLPEEGV